MARNHPPPPEKRSWLDAQDIDRLQRLIPGDAELLNAPECRIEYGATVQGVILRTAAEMAADLIVLSVRPEEPWATRLPDKAQSIVAGSHCPVLTVREKRTA